MGNKDYKIEIVRSGRKSVSVEIRPDLRVIVRTPFNMSGREVRQFIEKKAAWIDAHYEKMRQRLKEDSETPKAPPLSTEDLRRLKENAVLDIPARAAHYAPVIGVTFNRITIRSQTSRWGSCSSKGNLSFNCLLMLCLSEVADYVVVHELCHLKELNHSPCFWAEVERILPDYKKQKKWLKDNGTALIERLRQN